MKVLYSFMISASFRNVFKPYGITFCDTGKCYWKYIHKSETHEVKLVQITVASHYKDHYDMILSNHTHGVRV